MAGSTFKVQRTFVLSNDLACYGESKSNSAKQISAAFFNVEEAIKNMWADFRCNADAMILHRNFYAILICKQPDLYIAAAWTEFDSVIYQSHQRAFQRAPIPQNPRQISITPDL